MVDTTNYQGFSLPEPQLHAIKAFIDLFNSGDIAAAFGTLLGDPTDNTLLADLFAGKANLYAAVALTGANLLTTADHSNRHLDWSGAVTAIQTLPTTDQVVGDVIEITNKGTIYFTVANVTTPAGYKKSALPGETFQAVWDGTVWQSLLSRQDTGTVTLTDGANIAINADLSKSYAVTLAASRILDNPTNLQDGMTWRLWVIQGGAGSFTLTYGDKYVWPDGEAPAALSYSPGSVALLEFRYNLALDKILCSMITEESVTPPTGTLTVSTIAVDQTGNVALDLAALGTTDYWYVRSGKHRGGANKIVFNASPTNWNGALNTGELNPGTWTFSWGTEEAGGVASSGTEWQRFVPSDTTLVEKIPISIEANIATQTVRVYGALFNGDFGSHPVVHLKVSLSDGSAAALDVVLNPNGVDVFKFCREFTFASLADAETLDISYELDPNASPNMELFLGAITLA